jgi:hypothetical protein
MSPLTALFLFFLLQLHLHSNFLFLIAESVSVSNLIHGEWTVTMTAVAGCSLYPIAQLPLDRFECHPQEEQQLLV